MRRFQNEQRVFVKLDHYGHAVNGWGKVARLRRGDHGAWIALDVRSEHCPFPADDATRATHLLAYPDDCDPVAPVKPGAT